jgi:hypothetical protein
MLEMALLWSRLAELLAGAVLHDKGGTNILVHFVEVPLEEMAKHWS